VSPVIWVASYPKSGNTWTRALLASYVSERAVASLDELDSLVPDLTNLTRSGRLLPHGPGPWIIKTHFLPDAEILREYESATAKAIYLVRNPRDVIFSAARHLDISPSRYADFAEFFITHRGVPEWARIGFGTWPRSVQAWTSPAESGRVLPSAQVLVLKYEDMWDDPVKTLGRIVGFAGLGHGTDPGRVERAVENSSLDKMRAAEKASANTGIRAFRGPPLNPFVGQGLRNQSLASLGEGVEAAYQQLMTQDGEFARCVKQFGYEL
jgi:hypothetical protein